MHVDVMAGMDGQSVEAFQRDVGVALSLAPDSLHLSAFRPVRRDGRADPAQVARRREMVRWGERRLEAEGLGNHLGFARSRREDAVNAQLLEWRDRAASLLPFGVAAYGNSFGSHAYQVSPHAKMPGIDASIDRLVREPARDRRVIALDMDVTEEAHRFLLHTLLEGFSLDGFARAFGTSPRALLPEAFSDLEELGALEVSATSRSDRRRA